MPPSRVAVLAVLLALVCAACSGGTTAGSSTRSPSSPTATEELPETTAMVEVAPGRELYLHCMGEGSPTLLLEGGDDDTSSSYDFAIAELAETTRTCAYDRANLGRSDPDVRKRELGDLVSDLEGVLAEVPGPYVLVGTSGGGYITARYAVRHPGDVAGLVFVDVPAPYFDAPPQVVRDTRWNSPLNLESRDYLQVEKDAWAARRRIGDIPFTLLSNEYSPDEIAAAELPSERAGMRRNVQAQRGWLVLSPRARQVVVHTGHAVEEADPDLVIESIRDVVEAARGHG